MADPAQTAQEAAAVLVERTGASAHDIAVVLGSGWHPAADALGTPTVEIPFTAVPGFAEPQVADQVGTVRSVLLDGRRILVLLGRTHGYEGRGLSQVVHGVRTACAAGARVVVLTNAAGGIAEGLQVGQPVLISDHLNLTATSPLVGPRFLDLTDTYSPRLRSLAREIDSSLAEGVYAGVPGPHFETPAEVRMLRVLGADLVGMSTVLEAIAARAEGAEVLGISLVTNLAAGLDGAVLDHRELLAAAQNAAARMGKLLRELISRT
ncbi:MAG: purine-nucleoside phosphorylase [Actinomycetota bacterium]|nr:purine-nucleoside phosphorylase [Actinomycetota bacterium]